MCGFAGEVRFDGKLASIAAVERMCDVMQSRGPDNAGLFHHGSAALGHRRLKIIDLSEHAHQPMVDNALEDGMTRLARNVVVRPWLQDFGYTPEQVRAQIEVAEEYGLGWMLWNAASNVTMDALHVE